MISAQRNPQHLVAAALELVRDTPPLDRQTLARQGLAKPGQMGGDISEMTPPQVASHIRKKTGDK